MVAVECLAIAIGSFGVCVLFNVRGPGVLLCLIGGQISFLIYELTAALGISMGVGFFLSAAIASTYAELMARVRKCPATSYLLPSLFPLVPGTDIYYTMDFAIRGDMEQFLTRGLHTITLAGCLAIGVRCRPPRSGCGGTGKPCANDKKETPKVSIQTESEVISMRKALNLTEGIFPCPC